MQHESNLSISLLEEDSLSREQALAHDSFIVEAPAGAGKTELLTQRFLKLLETVEAPEEIIAITFTNKAASEMKSRIMDSLQLAANGALPEQSHKQITFNLGQAVLARSNMLGWHLLDAPSRLRIYTIDSLNANLARQMPLLSRFGTQPSVRDDPRQYYEEAAMRAIEHLEHPDYGATVQAALQYFDNDTYKLTQLLAEMLSKRDQWLPYTQNQHTAKDAEHALATMIDGDIQTAAKILQPDIQDALMPIARFAASQLSSTHAIACLLDWNTYLTPTSDSLGQWQSVAELLLTASGNLRKRLDKNMGLPATDEAKPYKEALTELLAFLQQINGAEAAISRLRYLPSPQQDVAAWQMIATLAQLLHIAVGELWLVFQTHGEVDFVEIAQRALFALQDTTGNATELALKFDYRIQHLLVDEFQDTSPSQIKLIQALTRGWQQGDGRTLFCVGDPMQSIYRFRKANVGLFLRVAQQGIGSIKLKPLKLWRNNRSYPPVLAWVNQAFNLIFPNQDSISRGAIHYRPFVATKSNDENAGVFVHALLDEKPNVDEESDDENLLLTDVRQLEADRIIDIIQQTRQQKPEAKIAVLVRARSHLTALVTEIRRNHPTLSFLAVEIEELANRQIVQDLLSLTYALHHRADRVHWLAILRAPWCGLTLADLYALVSHDKSSTVMQLMYREERISALSEDGRERVLHVRNILSQALMHRGRQSVSRWLYSVWLLLGGADCLWDAGDVRDVQAFLSRIEALERTGQFSPQLLATEVEKLYAAPDAAADDSLQFMTIHKSKGLEFDTVILPGLDRKTGGNDQPLLLWEEVTLEDTKSAADETRLITAPLIPRGHTQSGNEVTAYDYLKMLEKERAAFEDARVLYVAATRAERCLHLLGAAKIDPKGQPKAPKNTFLDVLWPIVHSSFNDENTIKAKMTSTAQPSIKLEDFIPQLIRLDKPTNPIKLQHEEDTNSFIVDNTEMSEDNSTLDADVGILTHLYLQLIAEEGIDKWSKTRIDNLSSPIQRWFKRKGYESDVIATSVARVTRLLITSIESEQAQWLLASRPTAANELAIESATEDMVSKKVIDRTFVENNTRWIIDYKTVEVSSNSTNEALKALATQYQNQLDAYEKLFVHEGLPIKKAIFFVSIGKLAVL